MSSTDKSLAQALGELEGFAMPARRDDAAIEAAVADDPEAAPILPAPELERRLAAERARDAERVARVLLQRIVEAPALVEQAAGGVRSR